MNENPENDAFAELPPIEVVSSTPVPVGCSPTIAKIAEALAKAQGEILPAPKDSLNPHFKSRYADLASVREASRKPLSDNGLAVIQRPHAQSGLVVVETLLLHSSGEWFSNTLAMPLRDDHAHGVGSAITYARRYSYCALLGVVADEDDDGNSARHMPPPDRSKAPTPQAKPAPKAAPKAEPEVRTQPKSDRPPPPVPSDAFDDSDEPCPEVISKEIGMIFRRLKMQPTETVVMCREVTGKAPKELTMADGEKLLGHVRRLEAAEKEAQAALPGNVG